MSLALVDYSDSSSDENNGNEVEIKSNHEKEKFPNPLKENDSTAEEHSPNVDHLGRVRSFAHERGIWATYVYIPFKLTDQISELRQNIKVLLDRKFSNRQIELHAFDEMHLTLTRTVVLRHHWIDEFKRSLSSEFEHFIPFQIHVNEIRVYCNDECTRTFVSLAVGNGETYNRLKNIVNRLDKVLKEFKLQPYYEEASFHVSFLWCVGDQRQSIGSVICQMQAELDQRIEHNSDDFQIDAKQLNCKIGNKLFAIG